VHLLLVDRLICPRCGPAFGLVLLADRVAERRVLSGSLGCPNCRDRFPVRNGFGDLRAPPRKELAAPTGLPVEPAAEETTRLAALLGVAEGPAHVALVGPIALHASALSSLVPELEVAAVTAALRSEAEKVGVSRMVSAPRLAFQSSSMRGIALSGEDAEGLLEEGARVVAPSGRVVLYGAGEGSGARAAEVGLRVLLSQADVLVTELPGPRPPSAGVRLPIVGD
jgi:uncharacterized protein YbaR (Trm112 family)